LHSDHYTSSSSSSVNSNCLLSEEDDDLFWWYLQFEQDKDPIARISEHIPTSKRDILSKLQVKGIITPEKYKSLDSKMQKMVEETNDELISCEDLVEIDNFDDEITHLLRTLVQSGSRQHLTWIQDTLLETCFVKLGLKTHLPEPIALYSIKMMTLVPLVPYTEDQRLILKDKIFLQLLKKIGFHLASDESPMFPRIPLFWTADVLFAIAARLGPIRKDKMKFSYEELLLADPNHDPVTSRLQPCPTLPSLSSCCTLSSWLAAVQKSKENQMNLLNDSFEETI
jgi:timeless protein